MSPWVERRFWLFCAVSIALHGALFALTAGLRQAKSPPLPVLLASIRLLDGGERMAPRQNESGQTTASAAPAAVPQKARQANARAMSRVASSASIPAGPAPARSSVETPATAQASAPSVAQEAAANATAIPAAAIVAEPAAAPSSRPAGETLESYRQRLTALFAGRHEYPRIAALRGWEGEVRLRLKIARKGNLLGVALDRSSGHEVLDRHALALLEGHGDLPPLPETLEAGEIQVIVPIHYKLRKTT